MVYIQGDFLVMLITHFYVQVMDFFQIQINSRYLEEIFYDKYSKLSDTKT
jgi:hypothetical protein